MSPARFLPLCVGYTNKQAIDGSQLICPNFNAVGNTAMKYWVSDIKVTGYEEDEGLMWQDYTGCSFCALTAGGATDYSAGKYFLYTAPWNDGDSCFDQGYWSDSHGDPITPHGAGDVQLEPGQALFFTVSEGDGEHPQSFCTAGEVIQAEIPFPLIDGSNAIGNPMAVPVWVSDLLVTGYEEDEGLMWQDYTGCSFCALTAGGATDYSAGKYFLYTAPWNDSDSCFDPGFWSDSHGDPVTPHGAGDVQLQPGQGIFFTVSEGDGDHPQTVTFPQVVNLK